jgi:uncharacterized membrane protein
MKRIESIDVVRGLVMIIMALDHVRDLIHIDSVAQSPTDLQTTEPVLFLTRWITYLCAPTFVFLAGTSVYLSFNNNGLVAPMRNFLLKRGLYLIALEFVVVNFALFFDPAYHTLLFEVIAAIGFGFIILGLSIKSSPNVLGIIGLVIIFGHNLLVLIPFAAGSTVKAVLQPLVNLSVFPFSGRVFILAYPPIPWLGIMLLGFASGEFFKQTVEKRKRLFVKIGTVAILLFCIIRYSNLYGDPVQWSAQKNEVYTFLSFMNVAKYPPSMLFCLVTLGIMFILLASAEQERNRFSRIAAVYGKVPLFYFILHFFLIHLTLLALLFTEGITWAQMDFTSGSFGRPKGLPSGEALWAVYLIWIAVVAALYKPCLWFGKYKAAHRYGWLKYT